MWSLSYYCISWILTLNLLMVYLQLLRTASLLLPIYILCGIIFAPSCFLNRSIKLCSDNSTYLKEKLKLIENFHVKLDYPLHVQYDMYNVYVINFTG